MQIIALPGQMDSVRCLPCTPTTVQLPKTKHDTGRVAAVIEHYDEMPLQGDDGDTYYVTSMQAIVRWCDKAQDWQILPLSDFKMMHPEDEHNNRRAAIMAQKARKKHGTRS
jgi:hypothetical protein